MAEVLSRGTRRFDLSVKLPCWLACPSRRHLLDLEPDRPLANLWTPGEPEADPSIVAGLDGIISLPALGIVLPMADLYEDVSLA